MSLEVLGCSTSLAFLHLIRRTAISMERLRGPIPDDPTESHIARLEADPSKISV